MSRVDYYRLKGIQIPMGILLWWWLWGNPLRDPVVSDLVNSTTKSSSSSLKQDSTSYIPPSYFYSLLFAQCSWSVWTLPHGDMVSQWGRNDSVPWIINIDPETAIWMGPRFWRMSIRCHLSLRGCWLLLTQQLSSSYPYILSFICLSLPGCDYCWEP